LNVSEGVMLPVFVGVGVPDGVPVFVGVVVRDGDGVLVLV
jgi:hypothetical protein